jgi:Rad3-related DNA helicase
VPAGKQMMEEGGTEQVSDEERKRLNKKQQKEQQEKLNEELIDLVLKLQKIEKQRKAAEIPHRESYQKLEKVTGRLFQVKLDATEALGKPRLGSQFNETKNRLLAEQKEQLEVFDDISKRKNKRSINSSFSFSCCSFCCFLFSLFLSSSDTCSVPPSSIICLPAGTLSPFSTIPRSLMLTAPR